MQRKNQSSRDLQAIELGKKMLPGILATSLTDPVDVNWVSGIIDYGNKNGLDMRKIYEQKRVNATKRGVVAPPYDELNITTTDPLDQLFD